MNVYHTILIAIGFSTESDEVAARALSIARTHHSALHVIHVIEPIMFNYDGNLMSGLTETKQELEQQVQLQMRKFGERYDIAKACQHLMVGSPAKEIHELANNLSADLIVIGSHGRSGFSPLLGSTASSVLHGSQCDVLAVRVIND